MASKHVVVKKKVRKKAAVGRPPASSPPQPGSSRRPPIPKAPGERFGFGDFLSLLAAFLFLSFVIYVFLPVDMSHVDGYPFDPAKSSAQPRNLLLEAENKLIEGSGVITFSEEEVNTYLNQRLKASQRGPANFLGDVEGIYLDLRDKEVTFYLARSIFGYPFIVSTQWSYYLADEKYVHEGTGSSIGRLYFKGLLLSPVLKPFLRIADTCRRESSFFNRQGVQRVTLRDGSLELRLERTEE